MFHTGMCIYVLLLNQHAQLTMGFLKTGRWLPVLSAMPSILSILLNSRVSTRRTLGEDSVLSTDSAVVKVKEILSLLPPGHWPFLSLEVLFGQFRMLSEESCVRIVGSKGSAQVTSKCSSAQPSLGSWWGFGTTGERMGWRSALLVWPLSGPVILVQFHGHRV